jgi:arginase family enzyme
VRDWSEDLPAARAVLDSAAAAVRDAFDAGALPVLTASDCSICIATFPEVVLREPDVHVAWIDAHGDFNTPSTTPSGFLGGMCLAAACGRWDADGGRGRWTRRGCTCSAFATSTLARSARSRPPA